MKPAARLYTFHNPLCEFPHLSVSANTASIGSPSLQIALAESRALQLLLSTPCILNVVVLRQQNGCTEEAYS